VKGSLGALDKNVVLGLFNYPTPDVGPDGTNEIDIEIARWGNARWPNGNYAVWPNKTGRDPASCTYEFSLGSDSCIERFTWTPGKVVFGSYSTSGRRLAGWTYQGDVASQPMPVFMNLWLFAGRAPSNGKALELEITSFKYKGL
jgi:hypothetical protein